MEVSHFHNVITSRIIYLPSLFLFFVWIIIIKSANSIRNNSLEFYPYAWLWSNTPTCKFDTSKDSEGKKFKKDNIILSITSAVRITEVITIISTLKKKQQYQSIWFFNIKLFFSLSPKDVSNKRFVHEKYRCIDLFKYDIWSLIIDGRIEQWLSCSSSSLNYYDVYVFITT